MIVVHMFKHGDDNLYLINMFTLTYSIGSHFAK